MKTSLNKQQTGHSRTSFIGFGNFLERSQITRKLEKVFRKKIKNIFSVKTGHTAYSLVTIENKCRDCKVFNCRVKCGEIESVTNSHQGKSSDNN